jgi:TonB family C-terminal domain
MNTKVLITLMGFVNIVIASNVYSLEPVVNNDWQRVNSGTSDKIALLKRTRDMSEANSFNELNVVGLDKVKWARQPRISITQAELEGQNRKLLLNVEANNQGIITNVTVKESSGLRDLDKKAIAAVKSSKIKPYQLNGEYYSFDLILPLEFYLE